MLVPISVNDLKPSMYVVIRDSWLKHPFLKARFLIQSQEQVDKLRASGLSVVTIDTEKGLVPDSARRSSPPRRLIAVPCGLGTGKTCAPRTARGYPGQDPPAGKKGLGRVPVFPDTHGKALQRPEGREDQGG